MKPNHIDWTISAHYASKNSLVDVDWIAHRSIRVMRLQLNERQVPTAADVDRTVEIYSIKLHVATHGRQRIRLKKVKTRSTCLLYFVREQQNSESYHRNCGFLGAVVFGKKAMKKKKRNSRGKMKRRDCRKADLSLRSLRPVVWALTLFDIKLQRWERQREAETETQRGRHQSSYAFRGCVNVSHAMMGRLVQGSIALITFISFGEFRQRSNFPRSHSFLSGKRTPIKIRKWHTKMMY